MTHTYTLDGTNILKEVWGGNTLIPLYDSEEAVCGIVYNGTPYYFLKNLQGDVVAILDGNGETVATYSYDVWGACTISGDTSGCSIAAMNPFRYRGYYFDSEIGMYYLQSRYYDPIIGRWLNNDEAFVVLLDQLGLPGANLFRYCDNDPIANYDPVGYLHLGKHWWNSVSTVSTTIDVLICCIPALSLISGYFRAKSIATAAAKTAAAMSRKKLREAFVKLTLKIAAKTGWQVIKGLGGMIVNALFTIFGSSLGDIIAKIIDKVDGKKDGYIYA